MSDKGQMTNAIDIYMNLQRIQKAEDRDKEIRNQMRQAKAKLEALGIAADELVIE